MEALQTAERTGKRRRLPKLTGKRKKWVLIIGAAAVLLLFFLLRPSGEAPAGGMAYAADTVQRRDITASVSGTGAVAPIDSYELRALVTGEVLEAPFEVGDQVEKGQLLYRLNAKDAEMGVQQAQLSLRSAQKNYDDLADSLTVTSPAAGVVQNLLVQKGDTVSPGTPIAEVADASTLTVTLPFHAADAKGIAPGQSGTVTVAGTMEALPATVESVSSAELVGTGGALVRQVKLRVSNPGALTAGHSATAEINGITCAGSGNFEENFRQTVTAQTAGEVIELPVTAGSRVSAGSALARLGGSSAQSALEDLSIALTNAELSLQRAEDALENYTITAPISGTVIEKNVKAGDKVDGIDSGALAVIYDLSCLKLTMDISELDLNSLRPDQPVEITADALPGQTFTGHVDRVSINGTTANGFTTYPATVLLEEYGGLNPGMNVSAEIIVSRSENALSVPAAAVARGDTVLVPREGVSPEEAAADPSKAEERSVTLGGSDGTYVEITSGLAEGDTVLVPPEVPGGMGG